MSRNIAIAIGCLALIVSIPAAAQRTDPGTRTQPDNSRANKGDPGPTADQQSETKADRELAQKIRAAITSDKSLSTYAHNLKVIVQNGVVTLRGPVNSDAERRMVESDAKKVAGKADVRSDITITDAKE